MDPKNSASRCAGFYICLSIEATSKELFQAIHGADHALWGASPARREPEVLQVDPSESTRRPDSIASAGAKACGASLDEYFCSARREQRDRSHSRSLIVSNRLLTVRQHRKN